MAGDEGRMVVREVVVLEKRDADSGRLVERITIDDGVRTVEVFDDGEG